MLAGSGSLWQLVVSRAHATPHARMLVDEHGRELSFGEYRSVSERVASTLSNAGIGPGDVVSWQLPTRIEAFVLAGALARIGAVQNPLLATYRSREVSFIVEQLSSKLLIVPDTWRGFDYEAMARELAGEAGIDLMVLGGSLPAADGPPPAGPPIPSDLEQWIFYTSGTTSDPKGVRHTDKTIQACAHGMNLSLRLGDSDLNALVFPFTHIGGITWLFSTLMTGCQQLLFESFDPESTIPKMAAAGVTLAGPVTPVHLAYLAAQRRQPGTRLFPSIRACPGGAAPKPPLLHYEMKAELGGAGIVSGYGLTECPILAMNHVDEPDDSKLAETEGTPTPGVRVRVVGADGQDCEPGKEGELRVTGPQLFKGYVDRRLDVRALDDQGFLRTGDLGTLDSSGYLRITGRLKDVIIRKGETISAKEVEDLLYAHPKVRDVAVIGLPDDQRGERACAVVCASDPTDPATLAELSGFLRDRGLMSQKIPEQLENLGELPRNASGKVAKQDLVKRFRAR